MSPPIDPLAARLEEASTWRVLALASGTVIASLAAILLLVSLAAATEPISPLPPRLHQVVVGLPAVLAFYEVGRRVVLRVPADALLAGWPSRTVIGWVAVGFAFPLTVLWLQLSVLGAVPFGRPPPFETAVGYVGTSLAAGLLAGVLEELAFRGALLRLLEVRWNSRVAVAASAVIFALLHQGHASGPLELVLVLGAMFAAGVFLGVVAVRTRSVWNAVALHAGWNTVFGGQVVAVVTGDGQPAAAVVHYRLPDHPVLLTGGDATLGAAPLTTGLLVVAAAVVAYPGLRSVRCRLGRPDTPGRSTDE